MYTSYVAYQPRNRKVRHVGPSPYVAYQPQNRKACLVAPSPYVAYQPGNDAHGASASSGRRLPRQDVAATGVARLTPDGGPSGAILTHMANTPRTARIQDLRPKDVRPLTFEQALQDVTVLEWIEPSADATRARTVTGITVASDDVAPGWIFVAIPGMKAHGGEFAHGAVVEGANAIMTDPTGVDLVRDLGVPIAVVADPRVDTAIVATRIYDHPAEKLVTMAITGTNGKTTTSFLMRAALQAKFPDPAICGTVDMRVAGMQITSTRTTGESPVMQRYLQEAVEAGDGAAVIEASAHSLSLNRLDGIVFDVAGFTNLQHDHLDYYKTFENYYNAKALLFTPEHAKQAVICVDDEWGQKLAREAQIPVTTVAAFTDNEADWHATDVNVDLETSLTVFTLTGPDGVAHEARCNILGSVNVQNATVAIVSGVQAGLPIDDVIASVAQSEQVPGRSQKVNPVHPAQPLVIVDYAHTPEGLEWMLRDAKAITKGNLVLVFGTDGDRDASKREDLAEVGARGADIIWLTDENPRTEDAQSIRDQLKRGLRRVRPNLEGVTEVTTCRRDALTEAILAAGPDDTVIVTGKGSEWFQEVGIIKHTYNDVPVAQEVLAQDPRAARAK